MFGITGKRPQIYFGCTRREFLEARSNGIKVYDLSPEEVKECGKQNVFNLGEDLGMAVRIEENPINEDGRPSVLEGILLQIYCHKTSASNGPAMVFLSLPDVMLLDCYHAVARCWATSKGLPYTLDHTLFINLAGSRVRSVDFTLFCEITGYAEYKSHFSRKVYATWMCNRHSMLLREYAAIAASHSVAVQQNTYLGASSRRLAGVVADQYFQRGIAPHETVSIAAGERHSVNPQYDLDTAKDLDEMGREDWTRYVAKRREEDLRIKPRPGGKEITPDVSIAALHLVVAVGCDGILGRKLNINILDYFLGGNIPFNNIRY